MDTATINDCMQKAEWRTRVMLAVVNRSFDNETLIELLNAGWDQAHSEGLQAAAGICQRTADDIGNPVMKQTAEVLANACRVLDAKNKADRLRALGQ